MTTGFEAVTPQRAVQIMRAWAFHSWPMGVQDGIDVYTNLGFKGDPQDPELFTSDMSPAKPDSYLVSTDGIIDESVLCLSAWLPEEYSESSRPRARAYYESFVRAFHEVLGGTRDSEEGGRLLLDPLGRQRAGQRVPRRNAHAYPAHSRVPPADRIHPRRARGRGER